MSVESDRDGIVPSLVLFDLDGTLVDTAPDLMAAVNALLAEEGRPSVSLDGFRRVVSRGGLAMLAHAYPDLDEARRAALLPVFLERYALAPTRLSRPFDGIETTLAAIEAAGARWGIVTNKPGHLADLVLTGLRWTERCAVLVAGDTLPVKKPDPAPLWHACECLTARVADSVYVGDDARDVQAARAAGMRAVAALWGYRAEHDDPRDWGGDCLVEQPAHLLRPGVLRPR